MTGADPKQRTVRAIHASLWVSLALASASAGCGDDRGTTRAQAVSPPAAGTGLAGTGVPGPPPTGGLPASGGAGAASVATGGSGGASAGGGGTSGVGPDAGSTMAGTTAGSGTAGSEAGAAGSDTAGNSPGSPASTGTTGCGQSGQTGTFQAQVTVEGVERGYFVSVPDDYDASRPNRLFFGYHGSGWNGQMMRGYLRLEEPPLVDGSLFVYPDGLPRGGVTEWDLSANGPDMAFFDAVYQHMTEQYCVDEARVFVNGQSFGGLMTNAVGCARGDVVRAIAVVAGSGPRGSSCQGQVAVWLTHGEDDDYVGFSSGESSRDRWVVANHCAATTSVGTPAQCQNYDDCDPGYPVIWCPHVGDAGHQHPSFGREAVRAFFATF